MPALRILDDRQRVLVFAQPPRRIVSLVPSDTLSLFALGAGDRLVGRTRYCTEPLGEVEKIPVVGGTKDIDVAAVEALSPDLILCNQEENARPRVTALIQGGLTVWVAFPRTVAQGLGQVARLARILGIAQEQQARDLLRRGYAELREAEAARAARAPIAAFVPIWMDPLMTISGETFVSDALSLAGARNVFAERFRRYPLAADLGRADPASPGKIGDRDTRYPRVTLQEVEERAPRIVLLPDEPHPFTEADAEVFRAQKTPAAREGRVRLCGGRDLTWYGAQSVGGLSRLRALIAALAAGALCAALPAHAYNEKVHVLLTSRALAARAASNEAVLKPPTPKDLAALRWLFFRTARELPDEPLRAWFFARFPTEESFDAWAFKELFLLDPAATVHGFDPTQEEARPLPRGELLARASAWPDQDARNQHRYLRDAQRQVVHGPGGEPLPDDPATLEMGSLTTLSSQAHAHYGLLPPPLSDDPEVLKKDPRHFAVPPDAHTFGADFVQLYTDLALLAEDPGLAAHGWLSATFAGAAFHHLEDLANQIHTVQVGIFDFFQAAWLQSKQRDLVTLGGLFGRRRSLQELGLRLVSNHHLLSEDLFALRLAEAAEGKPAAPEVRAAISGIADDDQAFAAAAQAAIAEAAIAQGQGRGTDGFGRAIAQAMIEVSSVEGPEVYRLAWQFSSPALRDGAGHEYDDKADSADDWLAKATPAREAQLARFYALEGKGLLRAGTALRLWQARFDAAAQEVSPPARAAAMQRTLAFLFAYDRARAERRAAFRPALSARQRIDYRWPAGAALVALALGFAVSAAVRRRRKLLKVRGQRGGLHQGTQP
jgi:ABC-type Fe3+-hydroxamate transport system substrate-binding protein